MIYFIQCGDDGPIKIGQTGGHVVWRCKQIQHSSPFELNILGCHEGGLREERELHSRFSAYRFRNEWFIPAQEILQHIEDTGAAAIFAAVDSDDLRQITSYVVRRQWPEAARKVYRDEVSKLGRSYTAWREHMRPLMPDTRLKLEAILRKVGVDVHAPTVRETAA